MRCEELVVVVAAVVLAVMCVLSKGGGAQATLSPLYYAISCPTVASIVEKVVKEAVQQEPRMAGSLARLHFHDCFVNGCDASILLDDTSTFKGEKTSPPNNNTVRGFDVVDNIKVAVEAACPATVSCADILALATQSDISSVGGPYWTVYLGRRDSMTANFSAPLVFIPSPFDNLTTIVNKFNVVGLSTTNVATLSGAHTIGRAHCNVFSQRLYNFSGTGNPDSTLDATYLASLRSSCPQVDPNPNTVVPLSITTPDTFDNSYYSNLKNGMGLLQSDEELYTTTSTSSSIYIKALVETFSESKATFYTYFSQSIIDMGNISPLTKPQGEIRLNCRKVNT